MILILGGSGFIGRHVAVALRDAGHPVTAAGRSLIDLARDDEDRMAAVLAGTTVLVNAAGLVRSRGRNTLAAVHADGAERLFRAAQRAGVRRLIHLSALGAATAGDTDFQRTKGRAEAALAALPGLDSCILRPSVVIGRGGASTRVMTALAALPFPPRLGPGTWQVQPVHVDDLAELVVRLVAAETLPPRLDVVGPEPLTTDQFTATLRAWLGLPLRLFLPLPEALLGPLAALGERLMDGPMNRAIVAMLKRGNTSDAGPLTEVLGRPPRALAAALARHPAEPADLAQARLFFVRPLLRWSLGLLWLATGLLSLGLYPLERSYALLAEVGLHGVPAGLALYGAAVLDLLLGLLLLAGWRPVWLGAGMLALMAGFTAIATGLPAEYWLHPFAPLLKNLPITAAVLAMMALEA